MITVTGKVDVVMEFGGMGAGGIQMSPVILLDCDGRRYELVPTPTSAATASDTSQGVQIPVPGSEKPLVLRSGGLYRVQGFKIREAVEARIAGSTNRQESISAAAESLAARVVPPPPSLMKGKEIDTQLFFPWSTAKLRYKLAIEDMWDRAGSNILLLLTRVEHVSVTTEPEGSSGNR